MAAGDIISSMFCDSCGTENKDSASYCRKCGKALEVTEIETRIVARAEHAMPERAERRSGSDALEPERVLFSITPTLKLVKGGYALAAAGALISVALMSALAGTLVPIWTAVLLGLLLFLVPAYFHLRQKLTRYTLAETKLEIDAGLIATTTRSIPLRRIQDVTVSATVLQRLAGLGDIVVDNASEDGGKIVLNNIDSPRRYCEMLIKQISKLDQ